MNEREPQADHSITRGHRAPFQLPPATVPYVALRRHRGDRPRHSAGLGRSTGHHPRREPACTDRADHLRRTGVGLSAPNLHLVRKVAPVGLPWPVPVELDLRRLSRPGAVQQGRKRLRWASQPRTAAIGRPPTAALPTLPGRTPLGRSRTPNTNNSCGTSPTGASSASDGPKPRWRAERQHRQRPPPADPPGRCLTHLAHPLSAYVYAHTSFQSSCEIPRSWRIAVRIVRSISQTSYWA